MKKIDKKNKIFSSKEFQEDRYKFNIILKILNSPELELYSDEENYMICRGAKSWPTWIWTKDYFDKGKVQEIEEAIKLYLTDDEKNKFTCKKELYDELVKDKFPNINPDDYFEMGFLLCRRVIKPKNLVGDFTKAEKSDRDILAKYWFDANDEMRKNDHVTMEKAYEDVDEQLASKKYFVIRDHGKIVCMASYNVIDNQAKINHVYTPKEERGKGYAANLIYNITKVILDRKLVPVLYTDYNYEPSNKVYRNVGYEDCGILINFTCSKR